MREPPKETFSPFCRAGDHELCDGIAPDNPPGCYCPCHESDGEYPLEEGEDSRERASAFIKADFLSSCGAVPNREDWERALSEKRARR